MKNDTTLQPASVPEMAKDDKKTSNYPTDTKVRRFEFWVNPEVADILDSVEGSKAEFVNRAIAEYWKMSEGETVPLVSKETISLISKRLAAQLKKDLELS